MKMNELLVSLNDDSELNESLGLIEDIIIDKPKELILKLQDLIDYPEKIANTNRFASLLSHFDSELFIKPLIHQITSVVSAEAVWLADYMYALENCLEKLEEPYIPDEEFVHLLGDWLLNTQGGELSWKASLILSELKHPQCAPYYEQGALSKELLHLSRIACLSGLVNEFGLKKLNIYQQLLEDEEPKVREAVESAIEWLKINK